MCVRTYRLFYVPHTEDFLFHVLSEDEKVMMGQRREKLKERQQVWTREVEAGEWLAERWATSAREGPELALEENSGPSTGVGASTEAALGSSAEGNASAGVEGNVVDHDVGASVSVVSAS